MPEGRESTEQMSMSWRPPGRTQQTNTTTATHCWPRKRPGFQHYINVVWAAPLRQGGVSFLPLFGLAGANGDNEKKPGVYLF